MSVVTTELEGGPTWLRRRTIGHYGGATDKQNCNTERTPWAWTWYRELQAMRGSAFSCDATNLVHAENLAIARVQAGISRAAEKLSANALPSSSDERLGYWVSYLAVPTYPDDTRHAIRLRCAAKYRAAKGATAQNTDEAVEALLGESWIKNWRQRGTDLATPPAQTFWPVINPGPVAYDLGAGTWLSERAHLVVEVQQLPTQSNADFLRLMNVHLFGLLDRMLDSHATFNWAFNVEDGFELDIDQLDYAGLG